MMDIKLKWIRYQMHTRIFLALLGPFPSTQTTGFLLIFNNCTEAEGIGCKRRSIKLEGNCWESVMGKIKSDGQVTPPGFTP